MKIRSFIVRALLFAVVLVPATMRVSAKSLSAPSCRVAKPQLRASYSAEKTGQVLDQFLASRQRHHAPAPRLHRIRGKKINSQTQLSAAPRRIVLAYILTSNANVDRQNMDGPNPSRGPPSQFSL
jgi:hypothetical protein